jgi:thermostable 8-oxoguanine DNA glycosylase
MSELATQAERYEQLSRKFTSLYHQPSDSQILVVSDLEIEIDEKSDEIPSQAFLRRIYDGFGESPAFLLELGIHTISQERTLAIRRINYFGSEQGLHFLKTLPIEKDIDNPKEDLNEFCRNYGQRFQAIKNQVILPYAPKPNESLVKLQTEFGLQLTEEIVSGGEGLSRGGKGLSKFAAILPEEEEEEVLYRPILLINIPTDYREDELPIIPRLQEKISEIHLIQPGREIVEGEPGALLHAIFDFGSALLANVQKRYSTNEEQYLVDIYKSFTDEIDKIIEMGIEWPILLSKLRNVVDKLSDEKEEGSTEKKAIREVLEFARRRSTSFLIGQWYPEFIDSSIEVIQKASKRPILDFIDQSGDLGILGPEGTMDPEQALEMILK